MTDIDNPVKCNRVEITRTRNNNKPVANLYAPRLEFPVLQLFDLAELVTIGIDPNGDQKEHAVIFFAHWTEGEKLNSKKTRNYRNVTRLEPLAALAPTPATSDPEALAQFAARLENAESMIRELWNMLNAQSNAAAAPFDYYYQDGSRTTTEGERQYFRDRLLETGKASESIDALRGWVRMKNRATARPIPAPNL